MVRSATLAPKAPPVPATSPVKGKDMSLVKKLGIGLIIGAALGTFTKAVNMGMYYNLRDLKLISNKNSKYLPDMLRRACKFWIKMGLIQDVLLTRAPKYVVKKLAPEKETLLDSTAAKMVRFAILSIVHLGEFTGLRDKGDYAIMLAFLARNLSIHMIKETRMGSLGAISAVLGSIPSSLFLFTR